MEIRLMKTPMWMHVDFIIDIFTQRLYYNHKLDICVLLGVTVTASTSVVLPSHCILPLLTVLL